MSRTANMHLSSLGSVLMWTLRGCQRSCANSGGTIYRFFGTAFRSAPVNRSITMPGRKVKVATTQQACSWDIEANLSQAEKHVREAAAQGANIILLQELFATPYFCQEQTDEHFKLAQPFDDSPIIKRFAALAKELGVVLPISYYERANNAYYNSLAVADADGTIVGRYRKSHIPDGPGYQEKWYFTPGDTGFRVFKTRFATIGVLICWDQWFPEGARAVALQGAELIFYPTAIGTEPQDDKLDSYLHWARVMMGHSGANLMPVIAANRVGVEHFPERREKTASSITFHGGSFITGPTGEIVAQCGNKTGGPFPAEHPAKEPGLVVAEFDLDAIALQRGSWGLFRDRRTDLYNVLLTKDGATLHP